jgi:hypothetical protein
MTQFTDASGNASEFRDATHTFGPYLRKVPVLTIGPKGYRGASTILDARSTNPGAAPGAWLYDATTGEIRANLQPSSPTPPAPSTPRINSLDSTHARRYPCACSTMRHQVEV